MPRSHRVCLYVTGHGFGHAARAQAVAHALLQLRPGVEVEIRTSAPEAPFAWLRAAAPAERWERIVVELERGVVQPDSFQHDIPATLAAWRDLLRRAPQIIAAQAAELRRRRVDVVVADVSPLACAAGRAAGLPVLVLGNFTWDWILEEYLTEEPGLAPVVAEVRRLYGQADLYLRLPMSPDGAPFRAERRLPLVARPPRLDRAVVRRAVGIEDGQRMVLVGFGGFGADGLNLDGARRHPDLRCVWDRPEERAPHLISVAARDLPYPDLIHAADVVLTKPGYSMIAESIAARTPIAFAPRRGFRESPLLERFLRETWPCLSVPHAALLDGSWADAVRRWIDLPPELPDVPAGGAAVAAQAILEVIGA